MSQWTHITATIAVDTWLYGLDKDTLCSRVQAVLDTAPRIRGSEGDVDVNFFVKSGHNHSGFTDGEWEVSQSCVTIVIQGDMRDRDKDEVKQELCEFVTYIDNIFGIRDGSYGLKDDWTGSEAGMIKKLISNEIGEEQ